MFHSLDLPSALLFVRACQLSRLTKVLSALYVVNLMQVNHQKIIINCIDLVLLALSKEYYIWSTFLLSLNRTTQNMVTNVPIGCLDCISLIILAFRFYWRRSLVSQPQAPAFICFIIFWNSLVFCLEYNFQYFEYPLIVIYMYYSLVLGPGYGSDFLFSLIVDGWWKGIKNHPLHAGPPKTLGLVHSVACKTCWNMAGNISFYQPFPHFIGNFLSKK